MDTKTGLEKADETQTRKRAVSPSPSPDPVSAQLRFFKSLSIALAFVLICGGAYVVYKQRSGQPVNILVNGRPVATVASPAIAAQVIQHIATAKLGDAYAKNRAQIAETVQVERAPSDAPFDVQDVAASKLASVAHINVLADAIEIDGKPIIALPDKDTAQSALDQVRDHYASLPPNDPVIDKPTFREKVTIVRERVPASICKASASDAATFLLTAPPAKGYTVQFHDTGWRIAHKFHLTFSEFIRANSGRDLDHMAPGDVVNISQSYPPLTVIVRKSTSETESIIQGESGDQAGKRQVTSIVTYMNGVRTGEAEPVSVYTVQRAKPQESLE